MTQEPKPLASKTTAYGELPALHLASLLALHLCDILDKAFLRGEPHSVAVELAKHGDDLATVNAQDALVLPDFSHAVKYSRVELLIAMGLCLKTDSHVLNRARYDTVGNTGQSTR